MRKAANRFFTGTQRPIPASLLIPETILTNVLAGARDYAGSVMHRECALNKILGAHLRALSAQMNTMSEPDFSAVLEVTLGLLASTLKSGDHAIHNSMPTSVTSA